MDRIYKSLPNFDKTDVERILSSGTQEELCLLPLSLGENYPDWKFAQDICVLLTEHENEIIKANAALGMAYIARTKGKLEKHIVKPVLLKLLKECIEYRWRIVYAIHDINIYMGWHLGENAIKNYTAGE